MAKLPRPQAPARFRAMFPDLADWLESPWTGPPPFLTSQVFRLEETIRDNCYVIRAELPGLDPENDIEITVDGRILTIRAERRQQDKRAVSLGVPLRIAHPRGQAPRQGRRRGRHRPVRQGSPRGQRPGPRGQARRHPDPHRERRRDA